MHRDMLVLSIILVLIGAFLFIWGAIYTVTTIDTVGTLFGWPIWNPPGQSKLPGGPTIVSVSANYALNYAGIVILLTAIIAARQSFF